MTREEAIEIFEQKGWWIAQKETFTSKQAEEIIKLNDAVNFALSALRPVSREQVDVVIKSLKLRLENNEEGGVVYIPKFAVERMIERLEAIENG